MGRARIALLGTTTIRPVAVAARFLEVARAANATTVVDLNVRPHLFARDRRLGEDAARLVRHAALVKASHDDLEALAPGRGLAWLGRHATRATWLVTRGAGRASAIGAHGEVHAVARRVRCVDATGAGDAFLAGVLAVLLATRAAPGTRAWADARVWEAALAMGHRLGARAVTHRGAATGLVWLDAVRRRLRSLSRAVLS
jgi:fructokinase